MSTQRILLAGLVASLVMGMVEMLYEALGGAGFWSPVVFIAATIVRELQSVSVPVQFQLLPVVLGLMGHMMNSVILGGIFAIFIAPRLHGQAGILSGALVYSLAVFIVMWFGIVPLVDPVMLKLNGAVFAVAHLMWGAVLGLAIGWQKAAVLTPEHAH